MGLRILHTIITANPAFGGPIEVILQLAREHKRYGTSVEILSLDDPGDHWVTHCEVKCHAVGPGVGKYGYAPRFVAWLKANASRYNVVIVNGIWSYASFGVWRALRDSSIPYFVFTHGMLDPYFKKQYPLKHLKKCLYWPWAEYQVLRSAKAVFFTCEDERQLARHSFRPYSCNEHVINYGTSGAVGDAHTQREAFFSKFPHLRTTRNLLFLGRVNEKKGIDLTLEGLAQCIRASSTDRTNDVRLIIAGPDDNGYATRMKTLVEKLGLQNRVTWTGMLRGELKWGAFHASEAFVLNSHQENFGVAVAEALSAGLPTLITDKVNIWREIEQSRAGLVASDDVDGATRLLHQWLDAPRDEWSRMRSRARECFDSRFHVSATVRSLLNALAANGVDHSR